MCEFWYYSCKHATKYACKLPKLDRMITRPKGRPKKDAFGSTPFKRLPTVPEDSEPVYHYNFTGSIRPIDPARCCPGFPDKPKETPKPCMSCISREEGHNVKWVRTSVEKEYLRDGISNNKFGYNSKIMKGYQRGGNTGQTAYSVDNGYGVGNQYVVDDRYGAGLDPGAGQVMSISGDPRQMMMPQGMMPQSMMPQSMMPQSMMPQSMMPQRMSQVWLPQQTKPKRDMPQRAMGAMKTMQQRMMPRVMVPQGMMPQGMMPQGMVPQGMMPQGPIQQGMMPRGPMQQGTMPQGPMHQGIMPQGPMPQGMMPRGPMQQGMMPQVQAAERGFMPPPEPRTWSQHPTGMFATNPYPAAASTPAVRFSAVDFAAGVGAYGDQLSYDGSTEEQSKVAFSNLWSVSDNEKEKLAGPVGRFLQVHGNGRFVPLTPPQPAAGTYKLPSPESVQQSESDTSESSFWYNSD